MLKLFYKIGDFLFQFSDNFFRDEFHLLSKNCSAKNALNDENSLRSVSWDLNQGLNTIFWKDFKHLLNLFIPAVFIERMCYSYKKILFLAEVDDIICDPYEISTGEAESYEITDAESHTLDLSAGNSCYPENIRAISFIKWIRECKVTPGIHGSMTNSPKYLRFLLKNKWIKVIRIPVKVTCKVRGPDHRNFFPAIVINMRN